MNLFVVIGGLFAMVGIAISIQAARSWASRRDFLRGALTVSGRVVGMIERRDGSESYYFPKVRFTTSEGREVTFESGMGTGEPSQRVGEAVTVCYRPDQPLRAEMASFVALWGMTLMLGTLGIVFLFVGVEALSGMIAV